MKAIKNKKAQVTVFIIIGLAILIVGLLLFSFRTQIGGFFNQLTTPEEQPVQKFIEDCMEFSSTNSITLMGLQGGYLELPLDLKYSDPLNPGYVPPPPAPLKIPMWWYEGKNYVPTLEKMEAELSRGILTDLDQCIDNFNVFQNEYTIEVEGDKEITTKINNENVVVEMKYPIKITQNDGSEIKLNIFTTTISSRLGTMYDFAKNIMNYENENAFLEDLTMDMIAVADGGNGSPHMPLEGWDINCGGVMWSTQLDLIPDLQKMVKYNFHFLSFDNAIKDSEGEDNPKLESEYCDEIDEDLGTCINTKKINGRRLDYYDSFYKFDTSSKDYPDITVKTTYDTSFGMTMKVEPSTGDSVKPFDMKIPLIGQCINIYHHRYNINFPIMFTLQDEFGYTFNFATPVVIEKNLPKRYTEPFTSGGFTYSPSSDDYCAQRIYPQDVFVVDKTTNEHVAGVNLRYECVQFGCDLGKTDYPIFQGIKQLQSNPFLSTAFPPCINGFLIASKDGYKETATQVTVDENPTSIPVLEMIPTKSLNISVMVAEFVGNPADARFSLRSMNDDETLFVSVDNLNESHESSGFLPAKNNVSNTLTFVYSDLEYNLDLKLMKNGQPIGGLVIPEWDVNKGQLSTAKELRVYAITQSTPPQNQEQFIELWKNLVIQKSAEFHPSFR